MSCLNTDSYHDDWRLDTAQYVLDGRTLHASDQSPTNTRYFQVSDRENGAENTADEAKQSGRQKHDDIHWNGVA